MDAQTQLGWDRWAKAIFRNQLAKAGLSRPILTAAVGEALATQRREIEKDFKQECGKLFGEIAALRARVDEQEREVVGLQSKLVKTDRKVGMLGTISEALRLLVTRKSKHATV